MSGGAAWIILSRHYRRGSNGTLPNFSSDYKSNNEEEKQQFVEERRLNEKKYNKIRKSENMKTVEVTIDRNKTSSFAADQIIVKTIINKLLYRDDLEVIHITSSSISLLTQLAHAVTLYDFELIIVEDDQKYVANNYGLFLPKAPPIWKEHDNMMFQHMKDNIYKRKLERKSNNN